MKEIIWLCLLVSGMSLGSLAFGDMPGTITSTLQTPSFATGDIKINLNYQPIGPQGGEDGPIVSIDVPVDSQGQFSIPQSFIDGLNSITSPFTDFNAAVLEGKSAESLASGTDRTGNPGLSSLTHLVELARWDQILFKVSTPKGESFQNYARSALAAHEQELSSRYLLSKHFLTDKSVRWELDFSDEISRPCEQFESNSPRQLFKVDFSAANLSRSTLTTTIPGQRTIVTEEHATCILKATPRLDSNSIGIILFDTKTGNVVGGIDLVNVLDLKPDQNNTFDVRLPDPASIRVN